MISAFSEEKRAKRGFTLAEVLITLSIIGVVAALTIPVVTKKFEKAEYIARYKETMSILSQATMMITADNGGNLGTWNDTADVYNAYLPYLRVSTKCENENPIGKCFASTLTYFNGTVQENAPDNGYCVVLVNGASICFTNTSFNADDIIVNIDTNGLKGPNVSGKDFFTPLINIKKGTVYPYNNFDSPGGITEEEIITECPDDLGSGWGSTCDTRIMRGDYAKTY